MGRQFLGKEAVEGGTGNLQLGLIQLSCCSHRVMTRADLVRLCLLAPDGRPRREYSVPVSECGKQIIPQACSDRYAQGFSTAEPVEASLRTYKGFWVMEEEIQRGPPACQGRGRFVEAVCGEAYGIRVDNLCAWRVKVRITVDGAYTCYARGAILPIRFHKWVGGSAQEALGGSPCA